ncbi:MAG: hypothetical protein MJZ11_04405 [Lachnospiraceae bacterium]|nr:hypothetical protein [Lachnospiraceae bacterium]
MGYGSYTASDWSKLKSSRNLSSTQTVQEVFKSSNCNPKMNPKFIGTRECFDSSDHPNTTPIVVALDVTGSMGYLAVEVATKALNELITKLYSTGAVEDPALMCAAYGDYMDTAPLQVTQFESDIRIAEQLLDIYFENKGSGQVALPCLWEFLAKHTNIDAVNKRKEKGFLFSIGDQATIRSTSIPQTITRVIGDSLPSATRDSLLKEVQEKFHVFHIMIGGEGNNDILPGYKMSISQNDIGCIPQIIISAIQLQKGEKLDRVLEQWDSVNVPVISAALKQLNLIGVLREICL